MRKILLFAGILMTVSAADAQTPDIGEMLGDVFDIADINGDGVVSSNEYGNVVDGVDADALLDAAQKQNKKSRLTAAFKTFDKDGDGSLNKAEFVALMQTEALLSAGERQAMFMDLADNPDKAEALLQDSLKKMREATERLNSLSADDMANNFIKGISAGIADENWFQMDKDKNGCVTEDEYAAYTVEDSLRHASDAEFAFTEDEARGLYREEKKAKPDCLTKEEYLRNYDAAMSAPMDGME